MSGWGGARVSEETRVVADEVARTHHLTDDERGVVEEITHALTYHRTYRHVELPALFDRLLGGLRPPDPDS